MPTFRDRHVLTGPPGREVPRIWPTLAEAMADRGPALLPVPADDPARTRILVEAMRPESPIDPSAALVVSTSGSTGTPKGAMLPATPLSASAAATDLALGGPGRWILTLPGHHIAGIQLMLRSLRAGHQPVIVDLSRGFDPARPAQGGDAPGHGAVRARRRHRPRPARAGPMDPHPPRPPHRGDPGDAALPAGRPRAGDRGRLPRIRPRRPARRRRGLHRRRAA